LSKRCKEKGGKKKPRWWGKRKDEKGGPVTKKGKSASLSFPQGGGRERKNVSVHILPTGGGRGRLWGKKEKVHTLRTMKDRE